MKLKHRGVAFVLGLTAGLASVTLGGLPAAAVGDTDQVTWKATGMDGGQTICTRPTVGQRSLVLIRLLGTWSHLGTGTNDLPTGSSVSTYPIYPGSNNSPTQISSAVNVLLPALPLGTERTAEVWISDGVHTQSFAFNIVVTSDCTGFRL